MVYIYLYIKVNGELNSVPLYFVHVRSFSH